MSKASAGRPPPLDPRRTRSSSTTTARWSASRRRPAEAVADETLRDLLAALERRWAARSGPRQRPPVADIDRLLDAAAADRRRRRTGWSCGRATAASSPAAAPPPALWTGQGGAAGVRRPGSRNAGRGQAFDRRLPLPAGAGGGSGSPARWPRIWSRKAAAALQLQRGKMVVELLPAGRDKGRAIADLLRPRRLPAGARCSWATTSPTRRVSASVNERGGMSVRVGAGRHRGAGDSRRGHARWLSGARSRPQAG